MTRFIIEHPKRGVLIDTEWTDSGEQRGRFSPTKLRTEAMCFSSMMTALSARSRIRPFKLQAQCYVLREPKDGSGVWKVGA